MDRSVLAVLALVLAGCGGHEPPTKKNNTTLTPTGGITPAVCSSGTAAINGVHAYEAVGDAVAEADDGDVVVVCAGTWPVDRSVGASTLAIRGETGDPADAVLEPGAGRGTILAFGRSAEVHLEHLTLRGATASAVTVADVTELVVEDCAFEDNHSDVGGGALAALVGGDPAVERNLWVRGSTFDGNDAPQGGALELALHDDAHVVIEDSVFTSNSADVGGAVYSRPIGGEHSLLDLERATFTDNAATTDGGAVATYGPGTTLWSSCTATGNTAGNAGGAYLMAPSGNGGNTGRLEGGTLERNVADGLLSGAVHLEPGWELEASAVGFGTGPDANAPKDVNMCPSVDGWNSFTVGNTGCHQTSR